MWRKFSFLDPNNPVNYTNSNSEPNAPDFASDPSELGNKDVAMDVSPDVAQKANAFAKNGNPLFFTGSDGKKYLIIHGTPDGYFSTGDPNVHSNDNNPTNDGFISKDEVGDWLKSKGWDGSVNIIACYAGRMEPISYSGGNIKSLFHNQGTIGLSTWQDDKGNNKLVFNK